MALAREATSLPCATTIGTTFGKQKSQPLISQFLSLLYFSESASKSGNVFLRTAAADCPKVQTIHPSMAYPRPKKPSPFLDLPAEIRNEIYQEVLISPKTFTVSRPAWFSISNTGLLCVNKQIHSEATSFFYENNIFRFPQNLFLGDPVIELMRNVYSLPPARLMTLKNLMIDIPVRVLPKFHLKL